MENLVCINSVQQLEEISQRSNSPAIAPQLLLQHKPDAHWLLMQDERIAAHCSLWWQQVPDYPNHKLGCIGHYGAPIPSAAQPLLEHVCKQLADRGCTMAIAPIDGNTWRRYRCLRQRGTEPLFFLEPDNADDWCNQFLQAGFVSLAEYSSALNADLTQQDSRMESVTQRLKEKGIVVRSLDLENFEQELKRIHQLSLISFRNNFLYTPIDESEFIAQYSPIKPYIQPELVLLAQHQDKVVGFLFAIPDLLQAKRGEKINTIIIKTVAAMPGRAYAGLGNWLVSQCQAIAHQLGYTRAIHALMHDANNSRNLSARYAHPIRRYTLFSKVL